mmetsp:Transcript_35430/g.77609  ORF Transcript_35430/g.77609 Transcript_35430/m.77609 type:complete len:114 (+) Transcript_35430:724-1065(+)
MPKNTMQSMEATPPDTAIAPPRPMAPAPIMLLVKLKVAPATVDPGTCRTVHVSALLSSDADDAEHESASAAAVLWAGTAICSSTGDRSRAEETTGEELGLFIEDSYLCWCTIQ